MAGGLASFLESLFVSPDFGTYLHTKHRSNRPYWHHHQIQTCMISPDPSIAISYHSAGFWQYFTSVSPTESSTTFKPFRPLPRHKTYALRSAGKLTNDYDGIKSGNAFKNVSGEHGRGHQRRIISVEEKH